MSVLADHAVEAIRLAVGIAGENDAGALRHRATSVLESFAAEATRAGHDSAAIDDARYALVALIDERALAPGSSVRSTWLDRPLQLALYDSFAAGEEFYRRLERWRHPRRDQDAEVLEVYHACLALGFQGMHAGEAGAAARRQLLESCAGEIIGLRQPAAAPPPAASPVGSGDRLLRWHGMPVWVVPLVAAAAVLLLWLAGRWWVAQAADRLAAELR